MESYPEIALFPFFTLKRAQRPPGYKKKYFFELPGYKNPMVQKKSVLSPVEKKITMSIESIKSK